MRQDVKVMWVYLLAPIVGIIVAVAIVTTTKFVQLNTSDGKIYLDTASALESRGLYAAELKQLELYREQAKLDRPEEANLLYKMGKLADENLKDCDQALAYYTMATSLRAEAEWAKEAEKRVVYCLEKTGNQKQAQSLLQQFTGGEKPATPTTPAAVNSPVVAVIDGHSVTWAEVQSAMKGRQKPEDLSDPGKRKQLLHQYVFTRMLADEAVRGGLDSAAENQPALEQAKREALAALYLAKNPDAAKDEAAIKQLGEKLTNLHQVRLFDEAIPKP